MNRSIIYFLFLCILLASCQDSEKKLRKENIQGEYIYRRSNEIFFTPPSPNTTPPPKYFWDEKPLTKDFFRCKGSDRNPVIVTKKEGRETTYLRDCQGSQRHGLPMRDGREFVYPCLIDLLNYVQQTTGHKVCITTGHRCPAHNAYCDPSPSNWGSKHMIGAEVDFYVEGMEDQPEKIISLLQAYYAKTPPFKGDKAYKEFLRFHRDKVNVSTPPWFNKEIFIKLYLKDEGRDFDNQHPYPYIGVQVRYDRELQKPVIFDQKQTQNFFRN